MLFVGIVLAVFSTAYANNITICEGVPVNSFIRDVSRCDGWVRCSSNGPVHGVCDSPWLFNAVTGACDWPENVQCFTCSNTIPIQSIPVNGSCIQFIRCINGRATQQACQNGLHFNAATEQCDLPENARCTIQFSCPANIPPGTMVTFRSQTNCSEYSICTTGGGNPVQAACDYRLHHDPIRQQCVFPEMTDCPLGPPDNGGGTTPNPGEPTTTPAPFNCPSDGHHPHPTTCSSFIVCASGTAHFFNCSNGLHFNYRTSQCDLPGNANCVRAF